jgi:hypothetical protein
MTTQRNIRRLERLEAAAEARAAELQASLRRANELLAYRADDLDTLRRRDCLKDLLERVKQRRTHEDLWRESGRDLARFARLLARNGCRCAGDSCCRC